jgi:hypothetical protein
MDTDGYVYIPSACQDGNTGKRKLRLVRWKYYVQRVTNWFYGVVIFLLLQLENQARNFDNFKFQGSLWLPSVLPCFKIYTIIES